MITSALQEKYGSNRNRAQIETLIELIEQSSVVGLANLSGLSSKALQGIRSSFRLSKKIDAKIKVAKNTLKRLALDEISQKAGKKDLKKLIPHINGSCAMIFSNTNPFRLQKFLNQNQVPAPAKVGQISPVDVTVPEGVTNLDPGPIISELGSIGLQTRIEKGKIKIVKTAEVLKIGDTVSESHAAVLARLGIQPFKVGLRIDAVLENGKIIGGNILEVDEDKIISDLQTAYIEALSLAISHKIAYYTETTIPHLLNKAISQVMSLSLESGYATQQTIDLLLAKANSQANILRRKLQNDNPSLNF